MQLAVEAFPVGYLQDGPQESHKFIQVRGVTLPVQKVGVVKIWKARAPGVNGGSFILSTYEVLVWAFFPTGTQNSTLADVLDKPGPENKRCIDPRGAERSDSARA